jgi:hypothetical protein
VPSPCGAKRSEACCGGKGQSCLNTNLLKSHPTCTAFPKITTCLPKCIPPINICNDNIYKHAVDDAPKASSEPTSLRR